MSLAILKEVFANACVRANLTGMFTFEREWTSNDLASLLFYQGVLTVRGRAGSFWTFSIPNFVIKRLYYIRRPTWCAPSTKLSAGLWTCLASNCPRFQ